MQLGLRIVFSVAVFVLVFSLTCVFAENGQEVLYEGDSIYSHITIEHNGNQRCMLFGRYRDKRETCIDLREPDASIFEYTALMFVGFLFHPETKDVALVGLGGGYIPTVFRMHLPTIKLNTIEVDPLVYKLAKEYFALQTTETQAVIVSDGRQYLQKNEKRYDQIWIDAFNTDYIPVHMTTKEFLQLVKSRLTKNGIVVQNVHNTNKLYDAHVVTFRSVFSKVFIFEGKHSGNTIIVGSDNPLFTPSQFEQVVKLGWSVGKNNLLEEANKYVRMPNIRQVNVLTDDFNPANLLLHEKR
jgi:spermidine synthase